MQKIINLEDIKRLVWKMKNLNTFCKYTKDYNSLENRLVITVIGKLDDDTRAWLKKQNCYFYEFNGIVIISLQELNLSKKML